MNSAIIVTLDRLNPGFLGPYGNTWVDTPAFNKLACQSLLVEHALTDSLDLNRVFRSYWTGRPAWLPEDPSAWSLLKACAAAGIKAALVTDDAELIRHPLAADFAEIIALPEPLRQSQDDPQDSAVAQVLQEAAVWLEKTTQPYLLWVHAQAMQGPWDARLALRRKLADEEDPPPPEWLTPPPQRLPADADPDIALGYTQAYAAQVLFADACLGAFLDALEALPAAREALLAVTSPRGFPLGEHGRLGPVDDALYAEAIQVPLFIRRPDAAGALVRMQDFAQPFDLAAAVADWCGVLPPGMTSHLTARMLNADASPRETAFLASDRDRAIRTPAWYLRETTAGESGRELFVKPDDRWEINEVASRCGAECEALAALLERLPEFRSSADFPALADELREIRR